MVTGLGPAQFAQAGVGILVKSQLASCVDEWIPLWRKGVHIVIEAVKAAPCV